MRANPDLKPNPNPNLNTPLTFTLEPLPHQPPQHLSTVVTEGGAHVVVGLEAVRHVDFKALLLELRGQMRGLVTSEKDRWQGEDKKWPAPLHSSATLSHLSFLLSSRLPSHS